MQLRLTASSVSMVGNGKIYQHINNISPDLYFFTEILVDISFDNFLSYMHSNILKVILNFEIRKLESIMVKNVTLLIS